MQANTREQGYNTSGAANNADFEFDEIHGNFTHSLQKSELTVLDVGGTDYFRLDLDLNEPQGGQGGSNSLISLQEMEIYMNTTTGDIIPGSPDVNSGYEGDGLFDGPYTGDGLGTLVYDMDAAPDGDSIVNMDDSLLSGGSGRFDVYILVPYAILNGYAADDYLYLFAGFGESGGVGDPSGDGFEEFAASVGDEVLVPVPAAFWLVWFGAGSAWLGQEKGSLTGLR